MRLIKFLGGLLLAMTCMPAVADDGNAVRLVDNGRPVSVLLLPPQAAADERLAAEELQMHIERMSGARIQIASADPADGRFPIRIGLALSPAAEAKIRKQSDDPAAFKITIEPDAASLAGLSAEGTLFAAYELLERLGCRWYLPGELGTVIPKKSTITMAVGEIQQAPSFRARHLQNVPQTLPWYRRQKLGGPFFPSCHGIELLPPLGENDTELLALVNGKRQASQLCISNPEVLRRAIAFYTAYFEKNPNEPWVGMGPNDGAGFCECPECRKLDAGDWDPFSAATSMTDRYIWFFNQVLAGIHKKFPDKKICFYCYANYQQPPRKVTPSPFIVPAFAPITLCRIHGMNNPICPDRSFYKTIMTAWCKLLPETYERGYYFNLACPQFPFSKIHAVRDETPFAYNAGVKGWRVECIPAWACTGPTLYVAARLMWDVHTDVDALLSEFYRDFFGPAATPMGEYLEMVDHAFRDTDCHTGGSYCMPHVFTPERMERGRKLLDKAANLARKDEVYSQRVRIFRLNYDRLESFLAMLDAENRFDFGAARKSLERLNAIDKTMEEFHLTGGDLRGGSGGQAADAQLLTETGSEFLKDFWAATPLSGCERVVERGEFVAGCPDEWDFLIDSKAVGEDLGWFRGGRIGGNWQKLRTKTASWSDQGLNYYKGCAWYRTEALVPESFAGRKIYLWFGGVDEKATVWLNGKLLGTSDAPGNGLAPAAGTFQPFEFQATDAVRWGGPNTVAVKIEALHLNELGTGGITAPVMFWSPRK